ncbi:LOW QUALITY PROTEIN: hypothetical protein BC936DRAFT_149256 [Jimgerdemannia flammicorona]|uniref:Uncharacterized protein n=1 Tax=Jimgerdemannia flammicorona TaxID=994334 RepID=A0A433D180_9FUNG|nr:LOW QUALITY PROTEIN: hypothetical protein BC936DRAFT_149256 [Jimgerdemannia flammicorona]
MRLINAYHRSSTRCLTRKDDIQYGSCHLQGVLHFSQFFSLAGLVHKYIWVYQKYVNTNNKNCAIEDEDEFSDDSESEEVVSAIDGQLNPFNALPCPGDSEWTLQNGKLNRKDLNAFALSVIRFECRIGLSSIVDLSSEFSSGMCTWFGDEWTALKAKVYERVNVVPKPFEEGIDQIEMMCRAYRYWDARDFLLDQLKDRSGTVEYQQIMKIYFTIIAPGVKKDNSLIFMFCII